MPFYVAAAATVVGAAASADASRHSANTQADAAKNASDSQLTATRETNQLNSDIYRQNLQNAQPYTQAGQLGLSALLGGLGLGPAKSAYSSPGGSTTSPFASGSASPTPGMMRATQTSDGVPQLLQASDGSASLGQTMGSDGTMADPSIGHINTGASQDELNNAAGTIGAGSLLHNFDANDLAAGIDPGYKFRMDQGNAALNAKRAAVGNRFGGQALKDITNYNQDAASQEFGNAYTRYNTNRDAIYGKLAGLAGVGQAQQNTNAQAGTALGQTLATNTQNGVSNSNNYLTSGAAARAAGQIGSTNAIVGGLNSMGNNWYQLQGSNSGYGNGSSGRGNDVSWDGNSVSSGGKTYTEGP